MEKAMEGITLEVAQEAMEDPTLYVGAEVTLEGNTESSANMTAPSSPYNSNSAKQKLETGQADFVMGHSDDTGKVNGITEAKPSISPKSNMVEINPCSPSNKLRPELDSDIGGHITADKIPDRFVQWGQEFPRIHHRIEPGHFNFARLSNGLHPTTFRIILSSENENEFNGFRSKLQ